MLRRRFSNIGALALVVIAAPVLMAQGWKQNRPPAQQSQAVAEEVEFQGIVESLTMGFGQGTPSFVLSVPGQGSVTIVLGPYRAWTDSGFELKAGMTVSVRAYASANQPNTYRAVEIKDPATGTTARVRAGGGMPGRARGGRAGDGAPPCAAWGTQLDLANGRTFDGTVVDVDMELGKGLPLFTLDTGKGQTVTIVASPYRALVDAGFAISPGDQVSVEAYPSAIHKDAYVAARITNLTTDRQLVLRDDKGFPTGAYGSGYRWRGGRCLSGN